NLLDVAMPEARKEWSDLQTFAARSLELPEMQRWDLAFVSEQYKQDQLELDSEALKVYFPLNQVLEGAFKVANQLHGLTFVHEADNPSYHEDVDCYEVWNAQGDFVAHLMADWHPRKGKRNGAWMTSYRTAYRENNQEHKPVISMVCNFSKSHGDEPALLTFREVTTLFHEFGHALHGLMGEGSHASLTGTHVLWDFVELPSQIMENWCYQPEALVLFAKHYLTGEPLPDSEVKKIVKAATFLEGMATVRQLSLGFLDLAWHHRSQPVTDGKALEAESMETFNLWNSPAIGMMSTAFSHIFAGGYSSGYYAYKWAEVLDADAFEAFVEAGIFDPDVADRFGQLLKAGGNVDPDVLYRQFRGRDPHVNALLKRAGLMTDHG
ncbi:MAG: M3 family peptidase, partial [Flavobacteriales bacterium]|nr:M3 family peptidase [Flavobacteriales bacterium]